MGRYILHFILPIILAIVAYILFVFLFSLLMGVLRKLFVRSPDESSQPKFLLKLFTTIAQLFFWSIWTAFCTFFVKHHLAIADYNNKWFYYITGYIAIVIPISIIFNKEIKHRNDQLETVNLNAQLSLFCLFALGAYILFLSEYSVLSNGVFLWTDYLVR